MQIPKPETLTVHDLTVMLFERMITLLKRTGGWIQSQMANNADGEPCSVCAADASCFCLIGARDRALHDVCRVLGTHVLHLHDASSNLYYSIEDACEGRPMAWNDEPSRTQEQVVKKVEQAFADWKARHAAKA